MNRLLICTAIILLAAPGAFARGHRHHSQDRSSVTPAKPAYSWDRDDVDLSPVAVQTFTVADQIPPPATPAPSAVIAPPSTPPTHARIHNALLEDGYFSGATHGITMPDIRSRDLFVLDITQSLEGGFDSVNMYDRGILSWGIMQWTAQSGSLAGVLGYIKSSLIAGHEGRLWNKTFVANGIDVAGGCLVVYGKPAATPQDARVALRGTMKIGQGDPKLMSHWVATFARAGRQGRIEELEVAYAGRVVDRLLDRRAPVPYHARGRSGITVAELTGDDPYAEALIFALWTNSPTNALGYVVDAANAVRAVSVSNDPALWTSGAFGDALLRRCARSRIGNWPARAALIEDRQVLVHTASADQLSPFEAGYQRVVAHRKQARLLLLASRGQPRIRVAASLQQLVGHPPTPAAFTMAPPPKPGAIHDDWPAILTWPDPSEAPASPPAPGSDVLAALLGPSAPPSH